MFLTGITRTNLKLIILGLPATQYFRVIWKVSRLLVWMETEKNQCRCWQHGLRFETRSIGCYQRDRFPTGFRKRISATCAQAVDAIRKVTVKTRACIHDMQSDNEAGRKHNYGDVLPCPSGRGGVGGGGGGGSGAGDVDRWPASGPSPSLSSLWPDLRCIDGRYTAGSSRPATTDTGPDPIVTTYNMITMLCAFDYVDNQIPFTTQIFVKW